MPQAKPPVTNSTEPEAALDQSTSRKPHWLKRNWKPLACVAVIALLLFLFIAMIFVPQPHITVDYLGQINARIMAVPADEQAWPVYRQALIKSGYQHHVDVELLYDRNLNFLSPASPDWETTAAFLKLHAPLLEGLREGSQKQGLGIPLTWKLATEHTWPGESRNTRVSLPWSPAADEIGEHAVAAMKFSKNLLMNDFCELLATDAILAMTEHDNQRALEDIRAIVGITMQRHAYHDASYQDISNHFAQTACTTASHLLDQYAEQLTDSQLIELSQHIRQLLPVTEYLPEVDALIARDSLQRLYSSRGRVTLNGIRFWFSFVSKPDEMMWDMGDHEFRSYGQYVVLPGLFHTTGSHREMLDELEALQQGYEQYARQPLWVQLRSESYASKRHQMFARDANFAKKYWPVMSSTYYLDFLVQDHHRLKSSCDMVSLAVAMEQYHRAKQKYPDALVELVPEYMDELPLDITTGLPLIYKIVEVKPAFFVRGKDFDISKNRIDVPGDDTNSLQAIYPPR